jgi:hypothetical protein
MRQHALMSVQLEPPNSVLLIVGREDFTPPRTFGGQVCAATSDCIAVGVLSVADGPTSASFALENERADLLGLGKFPLESEGLVSLRDAHRREYLTVGVVPGTVEVEVFGNDAFEPDEVVFVVRPE